MRLSVRKQDPGFNPHLSMRAQVLLDGTDVTDRCFTADEDAGKVWLFVKDENGKFVLNQDRTEVVEQELNGRVEIRIKEALPLRSLRPAIRKE